jgi:hypothetical protein
MSAAPTSRRVHPVASHVTHHALMAKQKAFLHIGLPHSGADRIRAAMRQHADALATGSPAVRLPASSEDAMFNAAVEIRREHKAWGLRRQDVEGSWAKVCRTALRTRDTVVMGHDLLAGCSPDEIALLSDQLPGCAVHVVLTVAAPDPRISLFPDDHDLESVLERWSAAAKSPDRVHVVVHDPRSPETGWRSFGQVVGFDTTGLALPAAPESETDAAAVRLLAEAATDLATPADLVAVADQWGKYVAERGFDVRGDLTALARPPAAAGGQPDAAHQLEVVADALRETVAEVVRLRQRTADLAARNAKLERKRSRLKRRLAETDAG